MNIGVFLAFPREDPFGDVFLFEAGRIERSWVLLRRFPLFLLGTCLVGVEVEKYQLAVEAKASVTIFLIDSVSSTQRRIVRLRFN